MTDGILDLASLLRGGVTGQGTSTQGYTAFSYPLDLPTVSGIKDIAWYQDCIRQSSESPFTYHRQVFRQRGERWRAMVTLPPMTRAHAAAWKAFILRLDGEYGTFLFGDVLNPLPRGDAGGSPEINGANQSGKILETKGWDTNVTDVMMEGDKIQIGTDLYEVTRDTNSDGSGLATLDIWPRLRDETMPDGAAIETADCVGTFQLSSSTRGLYRAQVDEVYYLFAFEIIEAL